LLLVMACLYRTVDGIELGGLDDKAKTAWF
jgi:hypothetical protein